MALLGTMYTMTTYGSWLRGDERGWVEKGQIMPPRPALQNFDRRRLRYPPFEFQTVDLLRIGAMLGESLISRLEQHILALTVQTWHVHFIVVASQQTPAEITKCAKDAVRYGLHIARPIWADGYDKRYCFDLQSLTGRIRYVERHNEAMGWLARPWPRMIEFVGSLATRTPDCKVNGDDHTMPPATRRGLKCQFASACCSWFSLL